MTNALDVVGLACIAIAGFLASATFGFGLVGAGCLVLSWRLSRRADG